MYLYYLTLGGVDEAAVVVDDAGADEALRAVTVEHDGGRRHVSCHWVREVNSLNHFTYNNTFRALHLGTSFIF